MNELWWLHVMLRSVDLCEEAQALEAQAQLQIDRARTHIWREEVKHAQEVSPGDARTRTGAC